MSLKIETDKSTEYKDLTITELDNLIFLIYRSDYNSYFHFAYNDKTEKEKGRFVGYGGSICSLVSDESFDDGLPMNVDLYITPNGMKTSYNRKSDNLINLQNIVIDIDSHNSKLSIEDLNNHIHIFANSLIDGLKVKPNYINFTGRGIHLWYCFEPCHVSLDKIVLGVADMLCNEIESYITNSNETELSLDRSSSLKLNGLFRLPYSYNTKAKTWSHGKMLHEDLPNINDLYSELKGIGHKSRYFADKKDKNKIIKKYKLTKSATGNNYTPCILHRKRFMDYLFRSRDVTIGSRDIMIFAMYATLINLYEQEDAREYCNALNDSFKEPLQYAKLCDIYHEVNKKRHKFTVEKFFDFVNATKEEREWFNKLTAKEAKRQEKRYAKQLRNKKVIELYDQGKSIVDISKIVGISRPTIYNIIYSKGEST